MERARTKTRLTAGKIGYLLAALVFFASVCLLFFLIIDIGNETRQPKCKRGMICDVHLGALKPTQFLLSNQEANQWKKELAKTSDLESLLEENTITVCKGPGDELYVAHMWAHPLVFSLRQTHHNAKKVPVYLAEDWSDVSHEAEFWARMIESGFTALFSDQLDYIDPILLPFDMLDLTPSPLMDLVVVVSDAQPMANDHFYLLAKELDERYRGSLMVKDSDWCNLRPFGRYCSKSSLQQTVLRDAIESDDLWDKLLQQTKVCDTR